MAWMSLALAGMFEMLAVAMINKFHQDKDLSSFTYMIVSFSASFLFLAIAMKSLPMGTAYAIWTGIGAAGGAILGILLYNEPKNWPRLLFISMVLGAAIGLKLIS